MCATINAFTGRSVIAALASLGGNENCFFDYGGVFAGGIKMKFRFDFLSLD